MNQDNSIWHTYALASASQQYPMLREARRADVAIVGGGITGLSAALHLAQQGVTCCVLEAKDIGYGGSGRNVGLVNAGLWLQPKNIANEIGEAASERLHRAFGAGPGLVFSLIEQHNMDVWSKRNGTLHLAHSTAGMRQLERRYQQLQNMTASVRLLDKTHTQQLTGDRRYQGALQDLRAGTIQPLEYVCGLAQAASAQGAHIFSQSPAHGVEHYRRQWRIKTVRGEVVADKVIIASNAYTDCLWPKLDRSIVPIHYFQCASEPMDAATSTEILSQNHGCWDTKKLMMSMRKNRDNRLILGSIGAANGARDLLLRGWAQRMYKRHFPQHKALQWQHCWHGKIAFTSNRIPCLYRLSPGIVACIGYNGRGIASGTVCGKAMADALCKDSFVDFPLPIKALDPVALNHLRASVVDWLARRWHYFQGRML